MKFEGCFRRCKLIVFTYTGEIYSSIAQLCNLLMLLAANGTIVQIRKGIAVNVSK